MRRLTASVSHIFPVFFRFKSKWNWR